MNDRKNYALLLLFISFAFFVLGMFFPLMRTGYGIGPLRLGQESIYLVSSFRYFFNQGEVFIGAILLFFTLIFPIIKYIFLLLTLTGKTLPRQKPLARRLDIINKWAMLDVFIVAVLIINMKFDSSIIVTQLDHGTTLFAISIILMMACSFMTGKIIEKKS